MSVVRSIFGSVRTGVRFNLCELPPGPGFAARRGSGQLVPVVPAHDHSHRGRFDPDPGGWIVCGWVERSGCLVGTKILSINPKGSPMVGKFTRRPALELLHCAQGSVQEAIAAHTPHERYAAAHLGALRAAAAVLAARAQVALNTTGSTGPRRQRIRSAWEVLTEVAPEFGEWAVFFAAGAKKRASAQAGIPCVTSREADDLVRDSQRFIFEVAASLDALVQARLSLETSSSDSPSQFLRVS
jgi:hypothetical protein